MFHFIFGKAFALRYSYVKVKDMNKNWICLLLFALKTKTCKVQRTLATPPQPNPPLSELCSSPRLPVPSKSPAHSACKGFQSPLPQPAPLPTRCPPTVGISAAFCYTGECQPNLPDYVKSPASSPSTALFLFAKILLKPHEGPNLTLLYSLWFYNNLSFLPSTWKGHNEHLTAEWINDMILTFLSVDEPSP